MFGPIWLFDDTTGAIAQGPKTLELDDEYVRAFLWIGCANLARGDAYGAFHPLAQTLAPAYAAAQARYDWIATAVALLLGFASGVLAFLRVRPAFSARRQVERAISDIANIARVALNKAEQLGLDDESPSQAKANAIARTLEAATDEAAVDAASAEFEKHRSALDETQQMALEVAVSKARERAKGKAKEGVE